MAITELAGELRRQGRDIISLSAGEPDFDTPVSIKAAAVQAIQDGHTHYTAVDGIAPLKAAIRAKFLRDNALEFSDSQIIVSNGAKQCLFSLCQALLNPGDEAIVPAPYWVSYTDMVRLAGGQAVTIDADPEAGFKITPAQLKSAIGPRSRLLLLNSPSNPTGASYTRAELQALGAVLQDFPNIIIGTDDIYEHIYRAEQPFCSFATACPDLLERTVTINGVSKCYAMTGWRIGYAAGSEALIRPMKTMQSQSTSNPCSISQHAAVAALNGDQSCVQDMNVAYNERHDYLVKALNSLPGYECLPAAGTFYAFPRVLDAIAAKGLGNDSEYAEYLLQEANIAVVPGTAFGAPGHIRLAFSTSLDQLEEAVARLRRCTGQ